MIDHFLVLVLFHFFVVLHVVYLFCLWPALYTVSPQVDDRCGTNEARLASSRRCVLPEHHNCTPPCGEPGGKLDVELGMLVTALQKEISCNWYSLGYFIIIIHWPFNLFVKTPMFQSPVTLIPPVILTSLPGLWLYSTAVWSTFTATHLLIQHSTTFQSQ